MSPALQDEVGGCNCKSSPDYGGEQRLHLSPGAEKKEQEGCGGQEKHIRVFPLVTGVWPDCCPNAKGFVYQQGSGG